MLQIDAILVILLIGWWMSTVDIPVGFSGLLSTGALRGRKLFYLILAGFLAGALWCGQAASAPLAAAARFTSPAVALVIAATAALTLTATYRITRLGTVSYAVVGAIFGWQLFSQGQLDAGYTLSILLSWVLAPVMSLFFTTGLILFWNTWQSKSRIHLLRQTHYLRYGLIAAALLLAVSVGINNGGVLLMLADTATADHAFLNSPVSLGKLYLIIGVGVISAVSFFRAGKIMRHYADREFYLNTPSVLCILLAQTLVLLFFSSGTLCGAAGLEATPLSIAQLAFGALIGAGIVRGRQYADLKKIVLNFSNLLLTPAIALILSFALFHVVDARMFTSAEPAAQYAAHPYNLTVSISALISILLVVFVVRYMRRQQRVRLQAQQSVVEHQAQLLENQKALTSMEIKAMVAENENLNNKLDLQRKELINVALNIREQKEFLEAVYAQIKQAHALKEIRDKDGKIGEIERLILQKMSFSQEMASFYAQVEKLHKDFTIRLLEQFPDLTEQERRLTTLLRLGFSTKYIATLMNISPKSVEIGRYRLRTKLGLSHDQKLVQFINSL